MYLITEFNEFKDIKIIKDFPNIRQTFGFDCGPSVIQMVALYAGKELRKDAIIKYTDFTNDIEKEGIDPNAIISFFNSINLQAELKQNLTIEQLKNYINNNQPVIIMLQAYSDDKNPDYKKDLKSGHYVVLIGYSKDSLIFSDSSSFNNTYLTNKELLDRWHDVDKFGNLYHNCGIVVNCNKKFNSDKITHMQ